MGRIQIFLKLGILMPGILIVGMRPAIAEFSADEIVEKNDATRRISNMYVTATLSTVGKESGDKEKKFKFWQKLTNQKDTRFYYMTRFLEPAKIKNEGVLFLEKSAEVRDIFLYFPATKRVRRVENNAQSGSFVGSVFSYSDISTPAIDEMQYKLEGREKCPGGVAAECYVLRATPKKRRIMDRIGYSSLRRWIRVDNFLAVQTDCYDTKKTLKKRLTFSDHVNVDPKKNLWVTKRVVAQELVGKQPSSTFLIHTFDVEKPIPSSVFTTDNLENP